MPGRPLAVQPPPLERPSPPGFTFPVGACDAHCHFFGPAGRFPYQPARTYEPAELPLERYEQLMAWFGLSRAVFVQPAVWGRDHRAICDALERGEGRYRAAGLVDHRTDHAELARLDEAGMRGARFNLVGHLGSLPTPDDVRRTIDRVVPLGWHLLFHLDAAALLANGEWISELGCPLVIDHMARVPVADGLEQPAFRLLLDLVAQDNVWVKISGADRMVDAQERLSDAVPFMAALARAAPERTLWGTDWPHPNVRFMPDDGHVADLLPRAVPDETARHAILVDNPARLYFEGRVP
ncbi:amidohydrolase family protein [Novosphingobium profundi]|uniref:amidohydrolase family protein n=1 Tax=Novosphingobium profundi TaxID=1774954 RepID=UPI001BDB1B9C|nr:amidohydrolase family protein [Novosphingobium profundi]MBT0670470.1 amidohydrolase family protein [Novosphingobium profundi]